MWNNQGTKIKVKFCVGVLLQSLGRSAVAFLFLQSWCKLNYAGPTQSLPSSRPQ